MTDQDIMNRVQALTGFGSVRTLPQRNEKYKTAYSWSIGSADAVLFLQTILPWLGERRSTRAQSAVENWLTNKKQSSLGDTECVRGHAYNAPGNRRSDKYGTCHFCGLENSRKYREKMKASDSGQ